MKDNGINEETYERRKNMTDYIFCLTEDEAKTFSCCGWNFIKENPDRLVEKTAELQENFVDPGYLRETQRIIYNGISYTVFKDYADFDSGKRIFLLKPCLDGCDMPSKKTD